MITQKVSLLDAIGDTPLIELRNFTFENNSTIWGKLECANPGGSIKSRTAYWMIKEAIKRGEIKEDSILVEASSGNQGIGVSMVGAALGLKVKIIMPENMSKERQQMMKAFGAEVILTPAGEDIGQAIKFAMERAERCSEEDPDVFWVNQFFNRDNILAHSEGTAQEIVRQLKDPVDVFVSGIGTGGTITGIGEVLKAKYPDCLVVAVEPENAAILQGKKIGHHIQQGIGDGLIPEILNVDLIDRVITVTDEEALATARQLSRVGLFVGISSGTNVFAAAKIAGEFTEGKNIVTILPDGGERYISAGIIE